MAETKLIRDHHLLTRNLKVNGNYLSNDGGDEGLSISDAGVVTASSQIDIGNMSLTTSELDISSGDLTIDVASDLIVDAEDDIRLDFGDGDELLIKENGSTLAKFVDLFGCEFTLYESPGGTDTFVIYTGVNGATQMTTSDGGSPGTNGHLTCQIDGYISMKSYGYGPTVAEASGKAITLTPGTKVLIDKNLSETTASTISALQVDIDRTGAVASGSDTSIGVDVDVNHTGASDAGSATINTYGIDIDVVGDVLTNGGSATSTAHGITLDISGSDVCNGIYLDNKNGGTDFKNVSSADSADYFTLNTIANGETTLTTVEDGVGSTAHLNMVADGDITLDADGDQVTMKFGGATGQIDFSNENSGDGIIRQMIDAKDLVIQQFDGNEVIRFTDGGDVKVTNTVYFAAETATAVGHLGTETIDWNVSQKQKLTITGTGISCNFTNPAGVCNLLLKVVQGDGSDVIGTWDSDILWAGGSAPTLSTGNGEIDILSFYWDGSKYYGVASLDFS